MLIRRAENRDIDAVHRLLRQVLEDCDAYGKEEPQSGRVFGRVREIAQALLDRS